MKSEQIKDSILNLQELMTILPLSKFETNNLKQLLRLSKIKEFEPGEAIIKEGDLDPWIYFLLSGNVKVVKDEVEIGVINKPGEIFGEMRILDGLARSASVYAENHTVCLSVNASISSSLTSDERADMLLFLYRIIMEYIALRLRIVNAELVQTKQELERLKAGNI